MSSRDTLKIYARSVAASYSAMDNEAKSEFLKDMYDKALEVPPNWTLDNGFGTNLDAIKSGKWLRKDGKPGGTNVASEGAAWCGIFATYCLWAIGVPVQWRLNVGITPLAPRLEMRSGYLESDKIIPGDICVIDENQHHFIVINRSENWLESVDGNLPNQSIGWRNYNIEELKKGALKQMEYDKSLVGKLIPDKSKYSFYFYRLL